MVSPKTIIPEGFAQITHLFSGFALPTGAVATYGVTNENEASAATLAHAYHDLFAAHIMGALSDNVRLIGTQAKLGPNETGAFAEYFDTTDGGAEGPPSPPNVTYLLKKQTELGGRRGRGRLFLPGVDETLVEGDGSIDPVHLAAFQDNIDDWLAGMTSGPENPVLLHRDDVDEDGEAIPDTAPAPTVITSIVLDSKAASQRRRLRR